MLTRAVANMSQHNNPNGSYQQPFNYTGNHDQHPYQGQIPQLHISTAQQTQQWESLPPPRSLQDVRNQAPSRFGSVHTARAIPNFGSLNRVNYHQTNPSPTNNSASLDIGSNP